MRLAALPTLMFPIALLGCDAGSGRERGSDRAAKVEWERATPASRRLDESVLDAVREELARRKTRAFLVVRNGKLVYEWYAPGYDESTRHFSASMAKSLVGGTSLLLALDDGRIHPDDRASRFIPAWRGDSRRREITIRQLATHSSGMGDAQQKGVPIRELTGWKGAFWIGEENPFQISLHRVPVLFPPGSEYHYSNPAIAALAYSVAASFRDSRWKDVRELLAERVTGPLGIPDPSWAVGYGTVWSLDGLSLHATWGGAEFTPRAAARIGQWMLQRGSWNGTSLVAPEWVDATVRDADAPRPPRDEDSFPASGLGWWANEDRVWTGVPSDAFAAAGAQHQVVLVVPSLEMVVVRNGGSLVPSEEEIGLWRAIQRFVFDPVMGALLDAPSPEGTDPVPHG